MASASSSRSAAAAIRRLPLQQSISALTSGEGSTSLPSRVKAIHLSFVSKNSPSGPRDFVRTIAPRLAYANPTLPFHIDRIRDPRDKSLDPKSPDAGTAKWEGGMPAAKLRVEIGTPLPRFTAVWVELNQLEGSESQSIDINALSSSQILSELLKASGGPVDVMAGQEASGGLGGKVAGSEGEEGKSMAEMLAHGADTTYADLGKEPLVGETPAQ